MLWCLQRTLLIYEFPGKTQPNIKFIFNVCLMVHMSNGAIQHELEVYLTKMFGTMVGPTIELQKKKLGINVPTNQMSIEDYLKIASAIKVLCEHMAGQLLAEQMYKGMLQIIEAGKRQGSR